MAQRPDYRGSWTSHLRVSAIKTFGCNELCRKSGMAKRGRADRVLGQLPRGCTGRTFTDQYCHAGSSTTDVIAKPSGNLREKHSVGPLCFVGEPGAVFVCRHDVRI